MAVFPQQAVGIVGIREQVDESLDLRLDTVRDDAAVDRHQPGVVRDEQRAAFPRHVLEPPHSTRNHDRHAAAKIPC